jgi:hypothetical protein
VELGNPWPAIRSLAERAAVHLNQHPRDRFVLDQVPEAKARITTFCWSFTHTTICRSYKSDITDGRALTSASVVEAEGAVTLWRVRPRRRVVQARRLRAALLPGRNRLRLTQRASTTACSGRRFAPPLMLSVCAGHGTKRGRWKSSGQVVAEPKASERARASPRGGVWRKPNAKLRGDEQEPDLRCDTSGTSGHVTAKSSICIGGVFYQSGVCAATGSCLTPGDLHAVRMKPRPVRTERGAIRAPWQAEVSRGHRRWGKRAGAGPEASPH